METIQQNSTESVMSVKDWLITMLIISIPLVGFIMIFVWAFGDNTNKNKANWAKASLLLILIILGIYAALFLTFGAALFIGSSI